LRRASAGFRIAREVLALALSLLCALFGLFKVLFTDLSGAGERFQAWLYAGAGYALAGLLLAVLWPRDLRRWRLWLAIPAVLVGARCFWVEPETALWTVAALGAALLGLLAGTATGARWRRSDA
jgi:hypothetical protein